MIDIKRMDIKEFQERGYLQEANRLFFHPLGMALEVVLKEDGTFHLGGIHDYRADPEGCFFGELNKQDVQRGNVIREEWYRKAAYRRDKFGWMIQPLEEYNSD